MSYRTAAQLLPEIGSAWAASLVYEHGRPSRLHPEVGQIWVGPFPDRADLSRFSALVLCTLPSEGEPQVAVPPSGVRGQDETRGLVRCALDDAILPAKDHRRAAAAALKVARWVRAGHRVAICCMQGRNRSTLVAALAVRALTNEAGGKCMLDVKAARDRDLRACESFTNRHFCALLAGLPSRAGKATLG